jgi:hypothetical protein
MSTMCNVTPVYGYIGYGATDDSSIGTFTFVGKTRLGQKFYV